MWIHESKYSRIKYSADCKIKMKVWDITIRSRMLKFRKTGSAVGVHGEYDRQYNSKKGIRRAGEERDVKHEGTF